MAKRLLTVSHLTQRDGSPLLFYRDAKLAIKDDAKRIVTVTLTSETPVLRWGDKEILSHAPGHVRLQRIREVGAFHLYHDVQRPVAAVLSCDVVDGRTVFEVQFGQKQMATDAWQDVKDNILRGASAGYRIHKVEIDEEARTVTAVDWEIYEGSFTTIPADPTVGVGRSAADQETLWRSLTTNAGKPAQESSVNKLRAILALITAHRHLEKELLERSDAIEGDTLTEAQHAELQRFCAEHPAGGKRSAGGDDPPADPPAQRQRGTDPPPAGDERQRAEQLRVDRVRLEAVRQAYSFDIELSDADLESVRSAGDAAQLVVRKLGEKHKSEPDQTIGLRVTAHDQDKREAAALDGLLFSTIGARALDKDAKDLGMRRKSPSEIVRAMFPEMRDFDRHQIANFATRQFNGLRLRDANQSAARLSSVLGAFTDKAVMIGYNNVVRTHERWTSTRMVDDFKPVDGVALVAGLLKEQQSKGAPGEEINLTEKAYNAALGLFLRTAKFSYQDWRNDDLGLFADMLMRIGDMAANTEEWQVYKTVVAATWTSYVTATAACWDDTNDRLKYTGFGNVQAALEAREITVEDEKLPLNAVLGTVLVPNKRYLHIKAALGQGTAGYGPTAVPVDGDIQVIKVPWLSNSSLGAGYSADDYYCVARNMDSVKVLRDRLSPQPRVQQIEAGSTPDQHFLIMHAFRAKLANQEAMQKGDWA